MDSREKKILTKIIVNDIIVSRLWSNQHGIYNPYSLNLIKYNNNNNLKSMEFILTEKIEKYSIINEVGKYLNNFDFLDN